MTIAIISDIHANLPALQTVLEDIDQQKPDAIYCLGDLVNFAGWDNEVVDTIRSRRIPTIQGNHDEGIGNGLTKFAFSYANEPQRAFGQASIEKVNAAITDSHRTYLRNLPFSTKLNFRFQSRTATILLTHGSPISNNDYVLPDTTDRNLNALLDIAHADILVMGHTHRPFHKTLLFDKKEHICHRHIVNAGSVGKPKHGGTNACYVLLRTADHFNLEDPDALSVEFRYVPYDTEAVIRQLQNLGMSNAYDHFLRTGK